VTSERLVIRTPDQRVRFFVSSTLSALAAERRAGPGCGDPVVD